MQMLNPLTRRRPAGRRMGWIALVISLTACQPTPVETPVSFASSTRPAVVTIAPSQTPHPHEVSSIEPTEPTATATVFVPTETATPILTPVSIPVSTFDATHNVTRTPGPAAVCPAPQANPPGLAEAVTLLYDWSVETSQTDDERLAAQQTDILAILDAGGANALDQTIPLERHQQGIFALGDLTGDGVAEVATVFGPDLNSSTLHVYGCDAGKYRELLNLSSLMGEGAPRIETIADTNANGVPDLVVNQDSCHWCYAMQVFEWDGQSFQSLVRQWLLFPDTNELEFLDYAELMGLGQGRVADLDGNGTLELILEGGTPSYSAGMRGDEGPWREQTITFAWDGHYFVWNSQRYAPAVFRYEALQDADEAVLRGDDDEALALYQDVIFSDQLVSWTPELWQQMVDESFSYPDVTRMPFNPTEHAALSAYARYRIMVLHVHRGLVSDAETVYHNLLDQVAPDSAGAPYLDLARAFWEAYQGGEDIRGGCPAAVTYATQHPEILGPLGNSDDRWWSHHYQPAEVCPFMGAGEP